MYRINTMNKYLNCSNDLSKRLKVEGEAEKSLGGSRFQIGTTLTEKEDR